MAIIWHEMWHGALEEASRQWFGDKDATSMTETLEPLHQMMEDGPETLHEVGFHHAFGRDLQEAHGFLRKYRRNGKEQELAQAWEIYYHVFRKINKHLPSLTTLELQYVKVYQFFIEGSRRPAPGRARYAAVWTGERAARQRR